MYVSVPTTRQYGKESIETEPVLEGTLPETHPAIATLVFGPISYLLIKPKWKRFQTLHLTPWLH